LTTLTGLWYSPDLSVKKVVFAVLSLFVLAGTVSANITSISFSGPGGTGSDGLTSGTLTEPRLTYTSIDFIDVTITVDSAGSYLINEAPLSGDVFNNTGQTWVAFDLSLQASSVGSFVMNWANNDFATVTQSPTDILFSNGSIADNGHFDPYGSFSTPSAGTFTIRETPMTAVPEPSSIGAMALAALGAIFFRRRC
jgi:hypothetical protein